MRPPMRALAIGLIILASAAWVGIEAAPEERPEKKPEAPVANPLEKPLHWSAPPQNLAPGLQVVLSWYIRFETPDGRTIPARVFLIERREAPSRILCLGHQIETTDGFTPDFDVAKPYVKPMGSAMYRVSLGNLEAFVRVVAANPKDG